MEDEELKNDDEVLTIRRVLLEESMTYILYRYIYLVTDRDEHIRVAGSSTYSIAASSAICRIKLEVICIANRNEEIIEDPVFHGVQKPYP